jgi:hypothetical protein
MTAIEFTNQFESIHIPIPGVRLPTFSIQDKYKKELNLSVETSNADFLVRFAFAVLTPLVLKRERPNLRNTASVQNTN